MKKLAIALLLLPLADAVAQQGNPAIIAKAASAAGFVPEGWKTFMVAEGDLNKDGLADAALILQQTDPERIVKNPEALGPDSLNLNRRILLVLFRDNAGGYRLAARNEGFLPAPDNVENPCESDRLFDTDALKISKGVLTLRFHFWSSCGSYGMSIDDYVFRYQQDHFKLIGYASESTSRSTGEINKCSVNFSTCKTVSVTGENMFEEPKEKPRTITRSFAPVALPDLETLTEAAMEALLLRVTPDR